jgi:phosphatidylserine/phosphatidylglycerophosphate/cardiolipin synthase-like enzyme
MSASPHARLRVVPAPVIQTLLLRDTRHGGPVNQPQTVARRLAAFVRQATATIDVAIYDFRLSEALAGPIVEVLSKAAARGVSVRIAYDAGKPVSATRATFAMLAADPAPSGTAQWVANHFGNTDVQIRAITAPSGQLMHSKYVVRDGEPAAGATATAAVWTGSANFTDDAWTLQENNIITVASAELAAGYRRDFDELWASGSIKKTGAGAAGTATDAGATVAWDFAPGDGSGIDAALAEAIAATRTRIVLATMVLTSHAVLSGLVAAIGNGLPVSGVYDSGQMGPIEREWAQHASDAQVLSDWRTLKKNLVAKKSTAYTPNGPHDFMHNKVLITDDLLITGSYNISANAEKNAENQLHISDDNRLVNKYAKYIATIAAAYQ